MNNQNYIHIIFTEKADLVLSDIVEKYNLEESEDDANKKFEEDVDPNEVVLVDLTKDFVRETIPIKEFLDSLRQKLSLSPEITKGIAKDIIENLVPLIDKVPEDQLEAYNTKKDEEEIGEQGGDLAQEILRKINIQRGIPVAEPEEQANPVKRVDIASVEENAENMERAGKNTIKKSEEVLNAPIQTTRAPEDNDEKSPFADEKKGPDDYREPIQ